MKDQTPKRIYGWLNSQLSIARFYGGIKYNGAEYVIAHDEKGQPLVRVDVKFARKPKTAREKAHKTRRKKSNYTGVASE